MIDTTSTHEIIKLAIDSSKPSITLESNWVILIITLIVLLITYLIKKRFFGDYFLNGMELEFSSSPKVTFKVERNSENLYIANRIYMELITRKAAITIDENNDVIEDVYNSWYTLFGLIREEVKSLPGKYLKHHDPTTALIGLTRKILNDALRPHLTLHQARFRKWYEMAKKDLDNELLSPQEIQRKYPDYENLIKSMKDVNKTLIKYAEELDKLIKGK